MREEYKFTLCRLGDGDAAVHISDRFSNFGPNTLQNCSLTLKTSFDPVGHFLRKIVEAAHHVGGQALVDLLGVGQVQPGHDGHKASLVLRNLTRIDFDLPDDKYPMDDGYLADDGYPVDGRYLADGGYLVDIVLY